MSKNAIICFRVRPEMRSALEKLAKEERRSLSSLIENILQDHVSARRGTAQTERRRYPRKESALPAVVMGPEEESCNSLDCTVVDLSHGGLRLALPGTDTGNLPFAAPGSRFLATVAIPGESGAATFHCRTCRAARTGNGLQIGAALEDADFKSYQSLNRYLL
jgi:hypothetical protein